MEQSSSQTTFANPPIRIGEIFKCNSGAAGTLVLIANWSRTILFPVWVTIGLIGNFLLFQTMRSSLYHDFSFSIYLKAIALLDSLFLSNLIHRWLHYTKILNAGIKDTCRYIVISLIGTMIVSNYLLLAANVDRLVGVTGNGQNRWLLKKRSAWIVCSVILLLVVSIIPFGRLFVPYQPGHYRLGATPCALPKDTIAWFRFAFPIFFYGFCTIVPMAGVTICSISLYRKIKSSGHLSRSNHQVKARRSIRNLFLISLYHLVSTTPFAVLQIITPMVNEHETSCFQGAFCLFINSVLIHFLVSNHCMKFYVMFLQSKRIRYRIKNALSSHGNLVVKRKP
ncbi:hypothetical protein ACOME3_004238 [Neoechinorhynchus agilis]